MQNYTSAKIVWTDDYFLDNEFIEKNINTSINTGLSWESIFGSIESNVYRLLNISIKMCATAKDAKIEVDNALKDLETYYFFILDATLPEDSTSLEKKDIKYGASIVQYMIEQKALEKNVNITYLSSVNPNNLKEIIGDSFNIKDRFVKKPPNQSFTIPDELQAKILFEIKNKVSLIDLNDKLLRLLPDEISNNIKHYFGEEQYNEETFYYQFKGKYQKFLEHCELNRYSCQRNSFVLTQHNTNDIYKLQMLLVMFSNLLLNKGKDFQYTSFSKCEENLDIGTLYCITIDEDINQEKLLKFMSKNREKYIVYIINDSNPYIANYMNKVKCFRFQEFPSLESKSEFIHYNYDEDRYFKAGK